MGLFDQYEIRARIAPAIIISLPMLIATQAITYAYGVFDSFITIVGSASIILLVLAYAISFIVRQCGKKIEPELWMSWGGAPSTRFVRWRDSHFGKENKIRIHNEVEKFCGIKLKSKGGESKLPEAADDLINQAFYQVKAIVRRDEPEGVWSKHNSEYGFHRNLMGSRVIWLLFSIFGMVACLVVVYVFKNESLALIIGFLLNSFLTIITIIWGWILLPRFAKVSADRYAESVWHSFLVSTNFKHRNK